MKKRIISLNLVGVLMLNFLSAVHTKAEIILPLDSIYYYIKVDTAGVFAGYLRVDPDTKTALVDEVKGDYALWKFTRQKPTPSEINYYITNKKTGERLAFDVPVDDAVAIIKSGGKLDKWLDLFIKADMPDLFFAQYDLNLDEISYYLTLFNDTVYVSPETVSYNTKYTKMTFRIERAKFTPAPGAWYRIKIDSLTTPLLTDLGYLRADTMKVTRDSLATDTAKNDLSLWQFELETTVYDTTYYKIRNKETGTLLAFKPHNDTIATVTETGALYQWLIPFFTEEKRTGKLHTRDTATHVNYYLSVDPDTVVRLVHQASTSPKLSFFIEDAIPPVPVQYRFDTLEVYKIKYITGPYAGKYMAENYDGSPLYLEDSVYAHIPDGQYVVNKVSPNSLLNRTRSSWSTDPFEYVLDTLPDWYLYQGDTVEVKPVTYGALDKSNPFLGYKYVHPIDLLDSCYYFSYSSPDSLFGRLLGADTAVTLLNGGDTAIYILEETGVFTGAPEVGGIASLRKSQYRLRSMADTTLYLSVVTGDDTVRLMTNRIGGAGLFYLKESPRTGEYYLALASPSSNPLVMDSISKRLLRARKDTTGTPFHVVNVPRPPVEEPDPYTYLKNFPDNGGKGFYEFKIVDPQTSQPKWLTKNFYDYAVLGKEGESMLRAGSFTSYDLQLWVDTARGPNSQPDKPSFHIVKDVDTTATNFDSRIEGYFLHVIDSANRTSQNVVEVDGLRYNRLNFVYAWRVSVNELTLSTGRMINEPAINEYRFYLQESGDNDDKYYLVTEDGYGDGRRTNVRGYLSIKDDILYVGPRAGAAKIQFSGSTVSNEVVPPAVIVEEANPSIVITGGTGRIDILNAAGQPVMIYNMLGQLIAQQTLTSNHETIPTARGIHIVKVGPVTRKVVVQ